MCRAEVRPEAQALLAELLRDMRLALVDGDEELALSVAVGPVDLGGE